MKFLEYTYTRPDLEQFKAEMRELIGRVTGAADVQAVIAAFDEASKLGAHINTLGSIAYVRNTINTADPFYDAQREFMDQSMPELIEVSNEMDAAMLASPFRAELEAHYGKLLFTYLEL